MLPRSYLPLQRAVELASGAKQHEAEKDEITDAHSFNGVEPEFRGSEQGSQPQPQPQPQPQCNRTD